MQKETDRKTDGKITADDRGFIGKKYPDFTYGLSGNVTYKRWTLQVVTYGVQGVDLNTMVDINGYFQYTSNDVTRVLDRWEPTLNPDGNMPKVTKADDAGNAYSHGKFLVIRCILSEDQQCKPEICSSGKYLSENEDERPRSVRKRGKPSHLYQISRR